MTDTPSDFPNDSQTPDRLTESAARTLDSLVDSCFSTTDERSWSPEGRRLVGLLGLLDQSLIESSGSRELLIDVTMARVMRAAERDLAGRIHPKGAPEALSEESVGAVDELVRHGWRDHAGSQTAAASLVALLDLNSAASANTDRSRLIDATLGRVQRQIESTRSRFRLSPERTTGAPRTGVRLSDFVAAAAAILLMASVVWPMLVGSRQQARDTMCAANLARTALGFSQYAADNRDRLPQAQASFLGGTWWDVGTRDRSHSANLYLLVKGGYASLVDLSCPGNKAAPTENRDEHATDWRAADEVSFSYQLPVPGRPGWNAGSRFVVLADRSPVVRRSRFGEIADPTESSRNHAGRGQNILFGDASIRFETSPILRGGDNIWLPGRQAGLNRPLTGRETPESDQDAFVGP